jgi:hypothetical protein
MNSSDFITKLKQYRHSSIFTHQLFLLPRWDSLTLFSYCNLASRIVDRHILARDGDFDKAMAGGDR